MHAAPSLVNGQYCSTDHLGVKGLPWRILVVSHSAVLYTGTAEVVRLIFTPLMKEFPGRYLVHQVGLLHFSAVTQPSWPITPTRTLRKDDGSSILDPADVHGEFTVLTAIQHFHPDLVFCHNDAQNVRFLLDLRRTADCTWKLVLYVNFDGVPVPAGFDYLAEADDLVTLSTFSRNAYLKSLRRAPCREVGVMYCPSDTERFKPASDRKAARMMQRPEFIPADAFVLGWVGRNQWRKQIWTAYELLARLRRGEYWYCEICGRVEWIQTRFVGLCSKCKWLRGEQFRDIFLWVHMPTGKEVGAWALDELEAAYDVRPGRDVHYTEGCALNTHIPYEDMPALYQAWDALIFLSGGEGFGLPAWEAMACELPVIYSDYSSHAEYLTEAGAGLSVGGILQPESPSGIRRLVPEISEAVRAVRKLYLDRECGKELGRNGRIFVERYSTRTMARRWDMRFMELLAPRDFPCVL